MLHGDSRYTTTTSMFNVIAPQFVSDFSDFTFLMQAKIVPESILQTCIKISNEPPSDMRSNMRRAFAAFSQEMCNRYSTLL